MKRSRALRSVNVYSRKSNVEDLKEIVNDFIMDTFNSVYVDYGTGQLEEVVYYKTIAIDTAVLLEELRIEAILRGVQIVQRKFNSVT